MLNPLNPKIKIGILICCPYSFTIEVVGRSSWNIKQVQSCVIMFTILMTTLFYKALILQGEIWSWSLLGLKGLKDIWWLRHLVLKSVAVRPTYVSVVPVTPLVVTLACYTISLCKHSPSNGHSFSFWQLHIFWG